MQNLIFALALLAPTAEPPDVATATVGAALGAAAPVLVGAGMMAVAATATDDASVVTFGILGLGLLSSGGLGGGITAAMLTGDDRALDTGVAAGVGGFVGESRHCFAFILAASVPLAAALFIALRRARPIDPVPVAALGTLGVAATAAFVLEFFHPFDVTVIDLALHLAAIALVIAGGIGLRNIALAPG